MPKDQKRKRVVVEEVVEKVDTPLTTSLPETPKIEIEVPKVELPQPAAVETKTEEVVPQESVPEPVVDTPPDIPVIAEATPETAVEAPEPAQVESPLPPTEVPQPEPIPVISPFEEPHQEVVPVLKNSDSTNPLIVIIPGIFLLGALLGGIYFYQKSLGTSVPVATASPVATAIVQATPAPSPTSSAVLDLSKYPINILNGSGIVGEASKLKGALTTAGFKVSGAGNASSSNFSKTVIKAKADVPPEFLAKLSATLSNSYVLDTSQVLALSSPDTVQVIIGSSKAK